MPIRRVKRDDATPAFVPWGAYVHRAGWLLLAAGAVLCGLGWYGIAGERYAERQIPYLASSSIPGAALIVAGAVLIARPPDPGSAGQQAPAAGVLVAEPAEVAESPEQTGPVAVSTAPPVAVPGGTLLHRPDCPLVQGKPEAAPAGPGDIRSRALTPCPVCEPGR